MGYRGRANLHGWSLGVGNLKCGRRGFVVSYGVEESRFPKVFHSRLCIYYTTRFVEYLINTNLTNYDIIAMIYDMSVAVVS